MRLALAVLLVCAAALPAQIAVRGARIHTMAGPPIENGVVLIRDGKIERVGPAAQVTIPADYRVLSAQVVTPGLIDARTTVGLSGYLNQPQDQDQLETSAAIQPELRALDAYNPREPLIEYLQGFGITTIHTGHAPGALISGQTMVVKTAGDTVEQAIMKPVAMIAASLGDQGRASNGKSPGTRAKMVAMLREQLIKAQEYRRKKAENAEKDKPAPDLRLDVLSQVLAGEIPLLITAHRAHDILTALRLAREFQIPLVLDGAAEAYLVLDEIKASGFPVLLHPTMQRASGETENLSLETAAKLQAAGIPYAIQSGFESYVPKTRVVLWEAAVAAANGLTFAQALAAITIAPAKLLKISDHVGSLEPGKDADLALFDGDPFEYTTHCTGVLINGQIVSDQPH